jgi:FlaG/FlaF family flagellin (archaellin)|tara:strand:- start:975 stop:1484 length:510 start_codon:yes stop_codon:yes gene_type:complete
MKKKGISGIIATMMMVGLVVIVTGVVFFFINGIIDEQIENSESCFGNLEKVTIDKDLTCLNSTSNELQFFINMGDIELTGLLVSVRGATEGKSFEINDGASFSYLKKYGKSPGESLTVPGKNSGVTYVVKLAELGITDADTIKIAPKINDVQCEVSDSTSSIDNCYLIN